MDEALCVRVLNPISHHHMPRCGASLALVSATAAACTISRMWLLTRLRKVSRHTPTLTDLRAGDLLSHRGVFRCASTRLTSPRMSNENNNRRHIGLHMANGMHDKCTPLSGQTASPGFRDTTETKSGIPDLRQPALLETSVNPTSRCSSKIQVWGQASIAHNSRRGHETNAAPHGKASELDAKCPTRCSRSQSIAA